MKYDYWPSNPVKPSLTSSESLPSLPVSSVLSPRAVSLLSNSVLWLSFLQMDVVYTFQTGQAPVPGALRRQPSVVSQHNDATAAKTLSSPTHVGLSSSSSLTNSAGAPPPAAAASSSTAGSESVTKGQLTPRIIWLDSLFLCLMCMKHWMLHESLNPSHCFCHQQVSAHPELVLAIIRNNWLIKHAGNLHTAWTDDDVTHVSKLFRINIKG